MSKNFQILLYILLAAVALTTASWCIKIPSEEETIKHIEETLQNCLEQASADIIIERKFQRLSLIKGNHFPDINWYPDSAYLCTSESGAYIVKSNTKDNWQEYRLICLSRKFEILNPTTEKIFQEQPFKSVQEQRDPFQKDYRVNFLNKDYYVKIHSQIDSNSRTAFLIFISLALILSFCFALESPLIATCYTLVISALWMIALSRLDLLDQFSIFGPTSYASSLFLNSYAKLIVLLISIGKILLVLSKLKQPLIPFIIYPLTIFITWMIPSLIADADVQPHVNYPFLLQEKEIQFWFAMALISSMSVFVLRIYQKAKTINIWRHILATALTLCLIDYLGFVDLLHVCYLLTVPFIYWLSVKLRIRILALPVLMLLISLGTAYSIVKFNNHKIWVDTKAFGEQFLGLENNQLDKYLLKEELKRHRRTLNYLDSADIQAYINEQILSAYLDHYEAIACDISSENQDTLLLEVKGQKFCLNRKEFVPEKGFPLILSDASWQVNPEEFVEYGSYRDSILQQSTSGFLGPTVFKKQQGYLALSSSNDKQLLLQLDRMSNYELLIVAAVILALLSALYFYFHELRPLLTHGLKLRERIRFALIGITIITAICISYVSLLNLKEQVIQVNKNTLLSQARRISASITHPESEVWNKGLLLVETLNKQLLNLSGTQDQNISFFQSNGVLAASSLPTLYDNHFKSHILPRNILSEIKTTSLPHFEREAIGPLQYTSLYYPVYASTSQMLGVLYLPYFDKQQRMDAEIRAFSSEHLRALLIVLLIAILLSYLLARSIGKPIKAIETELEKIDLNSSISPMNYGHNDEIGSLVLAYNQKVSELQNALNNIKQAERASAWKHMAQQVAHEIKNPLTPMKLKAQWLDNKWDHFDEKEVRVQGKQFISTMLDQIEVLKHIANEFSTYASIDSNKPTSIHAKHSLESIANLFSEARASIDITGDDLIINMDETLFKRTFVNLIKNAIQARKENADLYVHIELLNRSEDKLIAINDNGKGIPADHLDKIFEPNFTTKSSGTGLGLAMVKEMLAKAGAEIKVFSNSEIGTRFEVIFPKNTNA